MQKEITSFIKEHAAEFKALAHDIWSHPEASAAEHYAVQAQIKLLEAHGFKVSYYKSAPTAFCAEYGSGKIKAGFFSEYDALPGLSQQLQPQHSPVPGQEYGHACGHNLISSGTVAAAIALKERVAAEQLDCTVRLYGCPAEETMLGKHQMIDEGAFSGLNFGLTWHAFDVNKVYEASTLAVIGVDFAFEGTPAHAAVAPYLGRSALDAVELMNVGVNYLREHIIEQARIHYVITDGGGRPNVVPAHASSRYYVRAPLMSQAVDILRRVLLIAKGAATMTETQMSYTVFSGDYQYNPNPTLGRVLKEHFQQVEIPRPQGADLALLQGLAAELTDAARDDNRRKFAVRKFDYRRSPVMDFFDPGDWGHMVLPGSSDLGDVSYLVPIGKLMGAGWAMGAANHTWQATACSGTDYAAEISLMIADILSQTAYDVVKDPALLAAVQDDFKESVANFDYQPMQGFRFE